MGLRVCVLSVPLEIDSLQGLRGAVFLGTYRVCTNRRMNLLAWSLVQNTFRHLETLIWACREPVAPLGRGLSRRQS